MVRIDPVPFENAFLCHFGTVILCRWKPKVGSGFGEKSIRGGEYTVQIPKFPKNLDSENDSLSRVNH
jgi:hypothetical protein